MVSFLSNIYRETRYLESATEADLAARLDGLIANLVAFDSRGEPQFQLKNGREAIAFVELLEELNLRSSSIEPLLQSRLQKFTGLFNEHGIVRIESQLERFRGKECLFKFTKSEYVDEILNGEVRFRTASSYNNPNLSIAIRDDELKIEHNLPGLRMTTKDGKAIPIKDNRITAKGAGDYYVSCFSSDFRLQFFPLFDCDSCILIGNPKKFVDEVLEQHDKTFPKFFVSFGVVDYIDRYRQFKSQRPIEFRKSWDYSYEKEFRFVSYSEKVYENLEPIRKVKIDTTELEYCTLRIGLE